MSSGSFEVITPGALTTVQDGGRPGYLGQGIPPGGAQDVWSLGIANLLVGNAPNPAPLTVGYPGDAGLEITLTGPEIRFNRDAAIALTGARMKPKLDGELIQMWESVKVKAGSTLKTGTAKSGARSYLAIGGGIDVPEYLGSRSTYLGCALGGFDGRALRPGDVVGLYQPNADAGSKLLRLRPELVPDYDAAATLRVVMGPQDNLFLEESVEQFVTQEWTMTPVANRMGFRISGPQMQFKDRSEEVIRDAGSNPSNIVDDVTPIGGIQLPGEDQAIIMGVEVPGAGGYAKMATVVSSDLGRVGQVRPGKQFRFAAVDLSEASRAEAELFSTVDRSNFLEVEGG